MIDTSYYLAVFFIFVRLISFLGIITAFFPNSTPKSLRIFFTMILSFMLANIVDHSSIANINSNFVLAMYILNEFMTGILLGFMVDLCFYIFEFAGSIVDMQIGLSMLSMYDPNLKTNATLLSRIVYWVGILEFFAIDGPHTLIKELTASFNVVTIGKSIIFANTLTTILHAFTKYFGIGLRIALPIVFIVLIADLTLGLISRTVPQLNIMVIGFPIKILIGMGAFLIALPIIIREIIVGFDTITGLFHSIFRALPLVLIFAADEKTEEATPKKKSEARKKGQIAKSKDVNVALTMLACTFVLIICTGPLGLELKNDLIYFLTSDFKNNLTLIEAGRSLTFVTLKIGKVILPIVLPVMFVGVVSSLMQTKMLFSAEAIKPSFSKINPLNGFKNMFSKKSFVELIKNLFVVTVLSFIGYNYVKDNFSHILEIGRAYLPTIGNQLKDIVMNIFIRITMVLVVLGAVDYFVQFRMFQKDLKMSKQEIKEEYKQAEGDPQLKSKIKQRQREMATRRMMQAIPDATVVVTNPTHLAIAIKYKDGETEAPIVVAKGADNLALKIKEVAKENDVPIVENKPLARMMYETIELDKEIPEDMYQAVAEILAVVYKMKK